MAQQEIDFVVAAYREDGAWQVQSLPPHSADDMDGLIRSLRPLPSEGGTLGLVSVAEDFFLLVRVLGSQVRLMLSDGTAASEWPLASEAIAMLGDGDQADDDDDAQPVGDLEIVADLGVSGMDIAVLCDDADRYPDEILLDIAGQLGFRAQFEGAAMDGASV
jgi:putative tRNA adenosine deaminase-associated protein